MKPTSPTVLRIAMPVPVHRYFDYLAPEGQPLPQPGARVLAPFGRRELTGIVVDAGVAAAVDGHRLRPLVAALDEEAILDAPLLRLLRWAAAYYHQPPGELFAAALPVPLRRGADSGLSETVWRLSDAGRAADSTVLARRAPRRAELLRALAGAPDGLTGDELAALNPRWKAVAQTLESLQLVLRTSQQRRSTTPAPADVPATPPALTSDQQAVLASVRGSRNFAVFALFGVTGSGKTEVYLRLVGEALAHGRQSLVLVPEISLTPQLVGRFRARFGNRLAVSHSGLAGGMRLEAWRRMRAGEADILVGTRSAVFAPLPRPGLIILDEEHDASYRQQEGVRYSARDLAVSRGRLLQVPVLLGSATPSLETLHNCERDKYRLLRLPTRVGPQQPPRIRVIDLRRHASRSGLSTPLVQALERHLAAGGQAMLFLNRRGYAPTLFCTRCGHVAECRRCDARMTVHLQARRLHCHHCDARRPLPTHCEQCGADLKPVGQGTQKLEETLRGIFPDATVARLDRDATRRRGTLETVLERMRRGNIQILVGTQMLAKGHDFPRVTLAAVIDADQGLFGSDVRASERLAQTIVQVAGRAGRGEQPGEVLVQSAFPDHPLLRRLVDEGYEGFARAALEERRETGWPPYRRLAAVRAEAVDRSRVWRFLNDARACLGTPTGVEILGPAPAAMERRAGRYRAQLLLQSAAHRPLHEALGALVGQLEQLPSARRVRWSVEVDPTEIG